MNRGRSLLNQDTLREKPHYLHVVIGGLVATILFFIFLLLKWIINDSTALSIFLFDLLFVFLLLPLKGKLWHKLALLIMGNMVGLTFNSLFSLLATSENIFFVVAYPILNVIWMVVMWAIGLSILASYKK